MKKYEIIDFFSKVPKNKPSTKLCQANNFSNKIFDQKPHTPDINNQRSIVGIKQWKRSFYRFDSSNINTQYYRYGALNSYIKSFYNLYYNKKTFISKRARIKLKRNKLSSLILASKPDIKENSSKLQANIYIYDNTVQHQKKKLFTFNNNIKYNSLFKQSNLNRKLCKLFTDKDKSQINYSSNAYSRMYEYNKNLLYFDAINSLENNKNSLHAFHRNKYNNSESKVLNKKNLFVTEKSHRHFFYNKWEHYNKIFLFKYVKNNNRILILNKYINVVFNNLVLKLVYSYICLLYRNKNESKDYVNINSIAYNAIHKMRELQKTVVSVRNNEYYYILSLVEYIKLIEQYNNQILEKAKKEVSIDVVNALAETISKKFYKIFLKEKRELYTQLIRININYKPYLLNKSNYNSYLNNLNYIINGVFDKRVILNIIKVKYPILNIELALNTLSNKIRRKRTGLLNIVNKLLALVKLPKHYSTDYNGSDNNNLVSMDWSKFNNETLLNNHNTMGVNSYKAESVDITNKFIIKLFNLFDTNNRDAENITKGNYRVNLKINEMLSALRYKWIGGMKIEGNGRLTRRYTAARSLSKTKHKGFLKYKDYSPKRISYNMIRGFNKPNIDFSFANSKKRIGAFGIKGWLNSY